MGVLEFYVGCQHRFGVLGGEIHSAQEGVTGVKFDELDKVGRFVGVFHQFSYLNGNFKGFVLSEGFGG